MSDKEEDYELCMRAENVELPKEGFYGVTGGTGGLAGNTTERAVSLFTSCQRTSLYSSLSHSLSLSLD